MNSSRRISRFGKPLAATLGALLTIGGLLVPAAAMAVGNTLRIEAPSVSPALGGTFTVRVVANAAVPISGASTVVNFDKTRLQVTAVTRGAEWLSTLDTGGSPAAFVGFPGTAALIAAANAAGRIPATNTTAVTYQDGATALSAGADHDVISITFQVIACGNSTIDLPIDPTTAGGMLGGTVGVDYGDSLASVTSTGGTVINVCPTPTPVPTPTPSSTPTPPPASAPPGSGTTTVTGVVDAGFLALTVPASVTIPLARNALNTTNVPVTIFSNIAWNLNVTDPSVLPTKGHMVDGSKALTDPMSAVVTPNAAVNLEIGGQVTSGSNSANLPVALNQFVGPLDQPGSYGISLLFSVISGF